MLDYKYLHFITLNLVLNPYSSTLFLHDATLIFLLDPQEHGFRPKTSVKNGLLPFFSSLSLRSLPMFPDTSQCLLTENSSTPFLVSLHNCRDPGV